MLNAEVTKILFENEELKAERDAAKAKLREIGMAICCVNDFEGFDPVQLVRDQMAQYQADLEAAKAEAEKLFADVAQWHARADLLSADLHAAKAEAENARAGEARAVEALRKMVEAAQEAIPDIGVLCCLCGDNDGHIPGCVALMFDESADPQPALDWLAQREREAAAEELEKLAAKTRVIGYKLMLLHRAAALRVGKVQDAE